MTPPPIAVTGATGFLGSHIVASLHHNQRSVRAVVRNPGRAVDLASAGCEIVEADVLDRPALTLAFQG
ncbi:MAG: SDR family oxidoreductase, partial [Myxococcota bacterium]